MWFIDYSDDYKHVLLEIIDWWYWQNNVSMKYNLGYTVPLFAETICYFQSLLIIGRSSDQSYISFIISR